MNQTYEKLIADYRKCELSELSQWKGICSPSENPKGKILFTGLNPSKGSNPDEDNSSTFLEYNRDSSFWKPVFDFAGDLVSKVAYMDLFPVHLTQQREFEARDIDIRAKVLSITQREIERLNPTLIVHLNAGTSYYWGINSASPWMGYETEPFGTLRGFEIRRITGLQQTKKRILYSCLDETGLCGSLIMFYRQLKEHYHGQYKAESIILPHELEDLYERSKISKSEWLNSAGI